MVTVFFSASDYFIVIIMLCIWFRIRINIRVWCCADDDKSLLAIHWLPPKKKKVDNGTKVKYAHRKLNSNNKKEDQPHERVTNHEFPVNLCHIKVDSLKIFIFNLIPGYLCCDDDRPRVSMPFDARKFLSFRIICLSHEFEIKLASERDRKIEYSHNAHLGNALSFGLNNNGQWMFSHIYFDIEIRTNENN